MTFEYFINLDERGDFYADVRDAKGQTVFEIDGFDIFEDGYMKHARDLEGLKEYLIDLEVMFEPDDLIFGQRLERRFN